MGLHVRVFPDITGLLECAGLATSTPTTMGKTVSVTEDTLAPGTNVIPATTLAGHVSAMRPTNAQLALISRTPFQAATAQGGQAPAPLEPTLKARAARAAASTVSHALL